MTIESWKAEFYPTEAIDTRPDETIQHTLCKWTGTRPENLAKHGLVKSGAHLKDENKDFTFEASSCALCVHYSCKTCPLTNHTDKNCNHIDGAYSEWLLKNDPEPMIKALEEILAKEQS